MKNKKKRKILLNNLKMDLILVFMLLFLIFSLIFSVFSYKKIDNNEGLFNLFNLGLSSEECIVNYTEIDGNLVQNPYVECDNDNDDVPDRWVKDRESPGHKLNWIDDPVSNNKKVLASESNGTGIPYHFGWRQTLNLKPNTWYEFSASFASKDLMPNLNKTDNESLLHSSSWLGVGITTYTKDRKRIYDSESRFWSQGPELTDFDRENWVYRTYKKKEMENWRTVKKYFKTSKNIAYAYLKTYNYPPGKGYFDNFFVKEVPGNYNPKAVSFKKSGILSFIQYKGKDFFPIVSYEYPIKNGVNINLSELKQAGFNTAGDNFYKGMNSDEVKQMYENEDMAMLVDAGRITSKTNSPLGPWWHNDPEHLISYVGAKNIKRKIDNFGDFENALFFLGSDELDCHPAEKDSYIPNLLQHTLRYQYLKNKNSHKLFMFNNCHLEPYTGIIQDKIDYYYPFQDVISYTHNLNLAYPLGNRTQELDKLGEETRTSIELSYKTGNYKPHLAFGIGVRDWQDWDGSMNRTTYQSPYNYVPFNLQRYQIFSPIINKAVGVWFYFGNHLNLNEEYDNYHYQQIKRIVKELSLLKPILLEKEFYNEWNVSNDKIEIMMKKHNNKIYLLTASNSYENIQNIKISLDSKYKINSVTAINDIINGDINNPVNRVVRVNSDGHSFNDDFIGDNENSFVGNSTPGYKVHVYEIEYRLVSSNNLQSNNVNNNIKSKKKIETNVFLNNSNKTSINKSFKNIGEKKEKVQLIKETEKLSKPKQESRNYSKFYFSGIIAFLIGGIITLSILIINRIFSRHKYNFVRKY